MDKRQAKIEALKMAEAALQNVLGVGAVYNSALIPELSDADKVQHELEQIRARLEDRYKQLERRG